MRPSDPNYKSPWPHNTVYGVYSPPEKAGTIIDGANPVVVTRNGVTTRRPRPIQTVDGVTQDEFFRIVREHPDRQPKP